MNDVEKIVLATLKRASNYATQNEANFIKLVTETLTSRQADEIKSLKKNLNKNEKRHAELDTLIRRIYEDMVAGTLSQKRFEALSQEYEQEQENLEATITTLRTEVEGFNDSTTSAENFLKLARRYKDFEELTSPMIHEFIDKIVVHERAEKHVKYTTQQVDVYLNFIGTLAIPINENDEPQEVDEEAELLAAKRAKHREYYRRYREKYRAKYQEKKRIKAQQENLQKQA